MERISFQERAVKLLNFRENRIVPQQSPAHIAPALWQGEPLQRQQRRHLTWQIRAPRGAAMQGPTSTEHHEQCFKTLG